MKFLFANGIGSTLRWGAVVLFCLSVQPLFAQQETPEQQVSSRRNRSTAKQASSPATTAKPVVMLPTVIEDHPSVQSEPQLSRLPVLPPKAPLSSSRRTVIASELLVTPALSLEQSPPVAQLVSQLQPLAEAETEGEEPLVPAMLQPILEPVTNEATADETIVDAGSGADASVTAIGNLLRPLEVAVEPPEVARVRMSDLSNVEFADPGNFLKTRQFKFANPQRFLADPGQRSPATGLAPPAETGDRLPPIRRRFAGAQDPTPAPAQEGDVRQYLTVSDVDQPLDDNPFEKLEQADPSDLLEAPVPLPPAPFTDTYASLTGRAFQAHFASWNAHRFHHRPLYFEEVNLERYGNRRRFQELASGAHFFTSALLLPYQLGDQPPGSCVSTLGHERPGSCVPHQPHIRGLSRRGLFVQGLFVTALAL